MGRGVEAGPRSLPLEVASVSREGRRSLALRRPSSHALAVGPRSGNRKAGRLLILLLAVFVQHQDFQLILARRPARSRRCESEIRRGAAGQVERLLKARYRPALLAGNVVEDQSPLGLELFRGVGNLGDGVDRVVRAEAAGLLTDVLILADFQAADVGRRGVEFTGEGSDEQQPQAESKIPSLCSHSRSSSVQLKPFGHDPHAPPRQHPAVIQSEGRLPFAYSIFLTLFITASASLLKASLRDLSATSAMKTSFSALRRKNIPSTSCPLFFPS